MSTFTDELDAFAKRLGGDGYPTALIERASARMQAMEAEIVRLTKELGDSAHNKQMVEAEREELRYQLEQALPNDDR